MGHFVNGTCVDVGNGRNAAVPPPSQWREAFKKLTEAGDNQIRFIGLTLMLTGVLLLYLVK